MTKITVQEIKERKKQIRDSKEKSKREREERIKQEVIDALAKEEYLAAAKAATKLDWRLIPNEYQKLVADRVVGCGAWVCSCLGSNILKVAISIYKELNLKSKVKRAEDMLKAAEAIDKDPDLDGW